MEYNIYINNLIKDDNKFIYFKYIINNIDINNFDKIFNNYITNHNKKFDLYYFNCEFQIEFNYQLLNIEINFHHNTDYINLKCLFFLYRITYN